LAISAGSTVEPGAAGLIGGVSCEIAMMNS
jgi:hypothetical protein